mgnify:FL=1
MKYILRLFGFPIVELEVEHDDVEEIDEGYSDAHLHADTTIGFSPDPVFPDLVWEEEE